jgi:hypothetical protein
MLSLLYHSYSYCSYTMSNIILQIFIDFIFEFWLEEGYYNIIYWNKVDKVFKQNFILFSNKTTLIRPT